LGRNIRPDDAHDQGVVCREPGDDVFCVRDIALRPHPAQCISDCWRTVPSPRPDRIELAEERRDGHVEGIRSTNPII
jgi:hypothetical protein